MLRAADFNHIGSRLSTETPHAGTRQRSAGAFQPHRLTVEH